MNEKLAYLKKLNSEKERMFKRTDFRFVLVKQNVLNSKNGAVYQRDNFISVKKIVQQKKNINILNSK